MLSLNRDPCEVYAYMEKGSKTECAGDDIPFASSVFLGRGEGQN